VPFADFDAAAQDVDLPGGVAQDLPRDQAVVGAG
jgi:hypothetical protein